MQLLLGHSKLESTVRYLGIEVEDALELSEQTEIRTASNWYLKPNWLPVSGHSHMPDRGHIAAVDDKAALQEFELCVQKRTLIYV